MRQNLIYGDLTYKINGLLYSVHNERGRFSSEQQYCDAIEQQLKESLLSYEREKILPPSFLGETRGRNKIDFLIEDKVILEIKARRVITREDYYQIRRYLEAFGKKLGIIVNFRRKFLEPKRILNSKVRE